MARKLAPILGFLACLAGFGCVSQMVTKRIVEAPNRVDPPWLLRPENASVLAHNDLLYRQAWRVPVGPPPAELAVAVIEPGDYRLAHSIKTGERRNGKAPVWPQSDWTLPATPLPGLIAPKGTLLVLHGYHDAKENMIHWALFLAQHGYRIVLVDLRGHGRSTGDWIGYGAFEVDDLRKVIDALQAKQLLAGPLGVVGLSYGASVGLQLAGRDERVAAVVALEPFSDPRGAVAEFARGVAPQYVGDWTPADFAQAERTAGQLGHFAWESADILGAVERTRAPILYAVAAGDRWISPENSRRLAEHTHSPHAVLTVNFDNDGGIEQHVLLSWILEPIAPAVARWLDEALLHPGPDLPQRLQAAAGSVDPMPKTPVP